jgi:DNA-damage-inducible protein J
MLGWAAIGRAAVGSSGLSTIGPRRPDVQPSAILQAMALRVQLATGDYRLACRTIPSSWSRVASPSTLTVFAMPATSMVHVRVDEHLKTQARETLATMGLSVSDAVRVFVWRVVAEQQLAFAFKAPNAATQAAMKRGADDRQSAFCIGQGADRRS